MRAYPITQVSIDHVAQEVTCDHCGRIHELAGEKLGSFGFIVQATRLARKHASCSAPGGRASREAISRELQGLMESEAEEMQRTLDGHGAVIPFARGVTVRAEGPLVSYALHRKPGNVTLDARGSQWAKPLHNVNRPHQTQGRRIPADAPLCLVCGTQRTVSTKQICSDCQQTRGLPTCERILRDRADEAAQDSIRKEMAAGAGSVN